MAATGRVLFEKGSAAAHAMAAIGRHLTAPNPGLTSELPGVAQGPFGFSGDNRLIGQPDGAYSQDDEKSSRARLDV
jgi:hypothetical protein